MKRISLPTVSSPGTKQKALREGKARHAKVRKEITYEEHKQMHRHDEH
jgi:hypothetical protein